MAAAATSRPRGPRAPAAAPAASSGSARTPALTASRRASTSVAADGPARLDLVHAAGRGARAPPRAPAPRPAGRSVRISAASAAPERVEAAAHHAQGVGRHVLQATALAQALCHEKTQRVPGKFRHLDRQRAPRASSIRAATCPFGAIPRQSGVDLGPEGVARGGGRPGVEREEVVAVGPGDGRALHRHEAVLPGGADEAAAPAAELHVGALALLLRRHARQAVLQQLVEVGVEVVHLPGAHGDRHGAEGAAIAGWASAQARARAGRRTGCRRAAPPSPRGDRRRGRVGVLDPPVGQGVALDLGDRPPLREVRAQDRPEAGENDHHDGHAHEAERRGRAARRTAGARRGAGLGPCAFPSKAGMRIEGRVSGRSVGGGGGRPRRAGGDRGGGGAETTVGRRGRGAGAGAEARAAPAGAASAAGDASALPRGTHSGAPSGQTSVSGGKPALAAATPRAWRGRRDRTRVPSGRCSRYWLAMAQYTQTRS